MSNPGKINVYDPVCGSGGFMYSVADALSKDKVLWPNSIERLRVPHIRWTYVLERLEECREWSKDATDPHCMLLIGDSGVGKSTLLKTYLSLFPRKSTEEGMTIPVLYVPIPSAPTIKNITEALVVSIFGRIPDRRATAQELYFNLLQYLQKAGVELIILDEFQHVIEHGRGKLVQESSDWLKGLLNDSGIPIVLAGLENVKKILQANVQLERRFMQIVELKRFGKSDAARADFTEFLRHLEKHIPLELPVPLSSDEMATRFYFASNGTLTVVMRTVRKAVGLAKKENKTRVSPKMLSRGYHRTVTNRKGIDPFLAPFEDVVEAMNRSSNAQASTGTDGGRRGASKMDRPIKSSDVLRPK